MEKYYYGETDKFLKGNQIAFIKDCAKLMNTGWEAIAARPTQSIVLLKAMEEGKEAKEAIEDYRRAFGMRKWAKMNMRRGSKIAADLNAITTMNTSTKEVDRAAKALADASLTLKKFEAAMGVKGVTKKVEEATGMNLDTIIEMIDKCSEKVRAYSIKVSTIKEMV